MLTIDLEGLPDIEEKLNKVLAALDVTEILDESEALLLNRVRARFLQQVDPDSHPWPPSQRVIKFGGSTLFLSGTLFHSIQAFERGPDFRTIGTDVDYGLYHQTGGVHLPQRMFLGFSAEDVSLVEARILQRVQEAVA